MRLKKHEWLCYLKGNDPDGGVRVKASSAHVAANLFTRLLAKERSVSIACIGAVEVKLWKKDA